MNDPKPISEAGNLPAQPTFPRLVDELRVVYPTTASIWHDGNWNHDELIRMVNGENVDRNLKRFAMCGKCKKVIRVDKPIFGSLHLCE